MTVEIYVVHLERNLIVGVRQNAPYYEICKDESLLLGKILL